MSWQHAATNRQTQIKGLNDKLSTHEHLADIRASEEAEEGPRCVGTCPVHTQ
jgi:hypothetical protein